MAENNDDLYSVDIETTRRHDIWRIFLDFSNIFKAFIGTAYMGLPFGIAQSGIALAAVVLVIVAVATDHCCHLIVECKRIVVDRISARTALERQIATGYDDNSGGLDAATLENIETDVTYGRIGYEAMGIWGSRLVNLFLLVSQFGFCVNYVIFLGNTLGTLFPFQSHINESQYFLKIQNQQLENNSLEKFAPTIPSSAPSYVLLCLIPLPLFIISSFLRNIRQLGPVSIVANTSLSIGYVMVLVFILKDFKVHPGIIWAKASTFLVFFGQMTGSYEGIGTVIPIESSMKNNRHRFPLLLHIAIVLLSLMFAGLGVIGYLRYGNDVNQIILENLPRNNILYKIITIGICIGVVCTFPLQIYVVIEVAEKSVCTYFNKLILKICSCQRKDQDDDDVRQPLTKDNTVGNYQSISVNRGCLDVGVDTDNLKISALQRNIFRTIVVTICFGVGVVFRDDYVYFSSLMGALSSTVLAYVLPCLFHLRLKKNALSIPVMVKDYCLVIFGILAGCIAVGVNIWKIATGKFG